MNMKLQNTNPTVARTGASAHTGAVTSAAPPHTGSRSPTWRAVAMLGAALLMSACSSVFAAPQASEERISVLDDATPTAKATASTIAPTTTAPIVASTSASATATTGTPLRGGALATPASAITATTAVTSAALLPKSFTDQLPRDEKGRIIGGPFVPYLNYSPTMIAGKPCKRVTKWTWKVVKLDLPLRSYGIADDPCVIQNAVDDFVRTEFADPGVNMPETAAQTLAALEHDPSVISGLSEQIRTLNLKYFKEGKTPYQECDKPKFKLLDANPRTPLIGNNDGTISGKAIQFLVFNVASGVGPFSCMVKSYADGKVMSQFSKTTEQLKGKNTALQVSMLWRAQTKHWYVYNFDAVPVDSFYVTAKALWDASPIKP